MCGLLVIVTMKCFRELCSPTIIKVPCVRISGPPKKQQSVAKNVKPILT